MAQPPSPRVLSVTSVLGFSFSKTFLPSSAGPSGNLDPGLWDVAGVIGVWPASPSHSQKAFLPPSRSTRLFCRAVAQTRRFQVALLVPEEKIACSQQEGNTARPAVSQPFPLRSLTQRGFLGESESKAAPCQALGVIPLQHKPRRRHYTERPTNTTSEAREAPHAAAWLAHIRTWGSHKNYLGPGAPARKKPPPPKKCHKLMELPEQKGAFSLNVKLLHL